MHLLHSLQIVHIKHAGTRFQTEEQCFPNQFRQANKRSTTLADITHWTPKVRKTYCHKLAAIGQCNNKWPIVSPFPWHIQHHSAMTYPHLIRLSLVRILPRAAVQTKNKTLWGTLLPPYSFPRESLNLRITLRYYRMAWYQRHHLSLLCLHLAIW